MITMSSKTPSINQILILTTKVSHTLNKTTKWNITWFTKITMNPTLPERLSNISLQLQKEDLITQSVFIKKPPKVKLNGPSETKQPLQMNKLFVPALKIALWHGSMITRIFIKRKNKCKNKHKEMKILLKSKNNQWDSLWTMSQTLNSSSL